MLSVNDVVNSPATQLRWSCISLFEGGDTISRESDNPADFADMANTAVLSWVDFRTSDLEHDLASAGKLGFSESLVNALALSPRNLYEDLNTEMGFKLPSILISTAGELEVEASFTYVFLKKNLILSVHRLEVDRRYASLRKYADTILKKIQAIPGWEDRLTLFLMRLIETNNDRNFDHLRQIEERSDVLNKSMTDPNTPRLVLGGQIYTIKHALIVYLDALWETVDVIREMRFGDAELISDSPQLLQNMSLLAEEVNRHISLTENMSDMLASGLNIMQSIYNNQLQTWNNRLTTVVAYLTILGTAALVPNTLATILGNTAFNMDSGDIGWYLALLVGSTALAVIGTLWWVRRVGLIPKKTETN
jgi:magnesium transporter